MVLLFSVLLLLFQLSQSLILLTPPAPHYGEYDNSRQDLFDFYADFSRAANSIGEPVVLVATKGPRRGWDEGSYQELLRRINPISINSLADNAVEWLFFPLDDIWVRDFFPTQLDDSRLVRFHYAPAYLDRDTVRFINYSTNLLLKQKLWDFPGFIRFDTSYNDEDKLTMDGGGIVVDPENLMAVATERVLRDNPFLAGRSEEGLGPAKKCCPADPYGILNNHDSSVFFTKEEVAIGEKALARKLGYDRVAIVPEEPGVPRLGHIDGLCNWLAPGVLALSNFSDSALYKDYQEQLQLKLNTNTTAIKIVPFPYAVTNDTYTDGFESASGIYVNFLRTQMAIYLPVFGIPEDDFALQVARQHADLPVVPVNASAIAIMGGSVRCLSQHMWGETAEYLLKKLTAKENETLDRTAASTATTFAGGVDSLRRRAWLVLVVSYLTLQI